MFDQRRRDFIEFYKKLLDLELFLNEHFPDNRHKRYYFRQLRRIYSVCLLIRATNYCYSDTDLENILTRIYRMKQRVRANFCLLNLKLKIYQKTIRNGLFENVYAPQISLINERKGVYKQGVNVLAEIEREVSQIHYQVTIDP